MCVEKAALGGVLPVVLPILPAVQAKYYTWYIPHPRKNKIQDYTFTSTLTFLRGTTVLLMCLFAVVVWLFVCLAMSQGLPAFSYPPRD